MPDEMLAFCASALGVAMIALLAVGSHWVQQHIRAGLEMQTAVAVVDEAPRGPPRALQGGIAEQQLAVVAGLPGSSAAFRNPARGAAVKDFMNRALGIHVFEMRKDAPAPAK
jgi:hypothetical protein